MWDVNFNKNNDTEFNNLTVKILYREYSLVPNIPTCYELNIRYIHYDNKSIPCCVQQKQSKKVES